MRIIAHIYTDFPTKFGLPRQSGLVNDLPGTIVFEPAYCNPHALRGLEGYSHLWILWKFETDNAASDTWYPTVRPPRLGGNTRVGVFASRSPNRPNPIGLSCVHIDKIELNTARGPVIHVSGIDMMNGTPIYDLKPYLPYCDSQPNACGGFAADVYDLHLQVDCPRELCTAFSDRQYEALLQLLAQDPRPHYQNDANRLYGFRYAGREIKFFVEHETLHVSSVEEIGPLKRKKNY